MLAAGGRHSDKRAANPGSRLLCVSAVLGVAITDDPPDLQELVAGALHGASVRWKVFAVLISYLLYSLNITIFYITATKC